MMRPSLGMRKRRRGSVADRDFNPAKRGELYYSISKPACFRFPCLDAGFRLKQNVRDPEGYLEGKVKLRQNSTAHNAIYPWRHHNEGEKTFDMLLVCSRTGSDCVICDCFGRCAIAAEPSGSKHVDGLQGISENPGMRRRTVRTDRMASVGQG
jgi:hypothetical protein